ncbi:TMEM14 family protein [Gracilimonas sp. BCB1]|uniref:TMEM14 family protein n=1 Tax=Gracilimonas sp. BCB1 TaxID=3152362 RepID=UPI0032D94040
MGKLSDNEIRQIVQKATLLQKYGEQSSPDITAPSNNKMQSLLEITDELGIPRKFVYEAYVELEGVPVQEAMVIDNHDFNSTKVVGYAKGSVDKELFNELKSQAEYHFNSLGKVSRRRNKYIWKAKPVGPSKFIASANSPEIEFEQVDGNTKITVSQSLKTLNKLYLPGIAVAFGGFMLFAGTIFGQTGNEVAPPLIVSLLILTASVFYTRFINSRKKKRKKDLQELAEILSGKIERHFKSAIFSKDAGQEEEKGEIEIPENEYEEESVEKDSRPRIK